MDDNFINEIEEYLKNNDPDWYNWEDADKIDWNELLLTRDLSEEFMEKLNWEWISANQELSEEVIEKFADKVDWSWISCNQTLSEDFIGRFADKVDWGEISTYQELSEEFIEKFADNVDWRCISFEQKLSEAFIERHADKVDWSVISTWQKLSEEFIERHADKVDWGLISDSQKLSEEFIEKHAERLDWDFISASQELSEDFIERHADELNWYCISRYQTLSEDFIEKHADRVNWEMVFNYQAVSDEFIKKHADEVDWNKLLLNDPLSEEFKEKLDWDWISENQRLSEEVIAKFADRVDWDKISIHQKLSEDFIERHADKVNWEWISANQTLSEDFIKRHTDEVDWHWISFKQKLSEEFIERHADEVDWGWISRCQMLSENFIERHADKVDWESISWCQELSEDFIEKYADKVDWKEILEHQELSDEFREKHKNRYSLAFYPNESTPDLKSNDNLTTNNTINKPINNSTVMANTSNNKNEEVKNNARNEAPKPKKVTLEKPATAKAPAPEKNAAKKSSKKEFIPNDFDQKWLDNISDQTKEQFKAAYGLDLVAVLTKNQEQLDQLKNNLPGPVNAKMPSGQYLHISGFSFAGKDEDTGKNLYDITANAINLEKKIGPDGNYVRDSENKIMMSYGRFSIEEGDKVIANGIEITDAEIIDHLRLTGRSDQPVQLPFSKSDGSVTQEDCALFFDSLKAPVVGEDGTRSHILIPIKCEDLDRKMNPTIGKGQWKTEGEVRTDELTGKPIKPKSTMTYSLKDSKDGPVMVAVNAAYKNDNGDVILRLAFTDPTNGKPLKIKSEDTPTNIVEVPYIEHGKNHTNFEQDGKRVSMNVELVRGSKVSLSKFQIDYLANIQSRTLSDRAIVTIPDSKARNMIPEGRCAMVDTPQSPSFVLPIVRREEKVVDGVKKTVPVFGPMEACKDTDARYVAVDITKAGAINICSNAKEYQTEKNKIAMAEGKGKSKSQAETKVKAVTPGKSGVSFG